MTAKILFGVKFPKNWKENLEKQKDEQYQKLIHGWYFGETQEEKEASAVAATRYWAEKKGRDPDEAVKQMYEERKKNEALDKQREAEDLARLKKEWAAIQMEKEERGESREATPEEMDFFFKMEDRLQEDYNRRFPKSTPNSEPQEKAPSESSASTSEK